MYFGCIRIAPSRRIVSPFSMTFSMMALARCAYSFGMPRRGGNGTILPRESRTSCGMPISIGVSKMPGAMVITRMPLRARSRAIGRVMPATAALDEP